MPLPRILYLANSFVPPGGVQNLSRLTISVLNELQNDGELKYGALVRNGGNPPDLQASRARNLGPLMQAKVAWNTFVRRVDCIFSDHLYTARFASRVGAKHIFWAHLIEFESPLDAMHQRSADSSFRIVCNSNHTLARLAALHPETEPKLRVVQLGDQRREVLSDPLYHQNLPARQLTMIGRMDANERYKGHDQVLESLPLVLPNFPDCKVNIIGEGSDTQRLQEKATAMGLTGSVAFLGSLADSSMFDAIKCSTGLLLPSLREGFGLIFLYAMWAGIPAVALSDTVAEEVLGPCGVYADSQTPEEIAKAIEKVLSGTWTFSREAQSRYDQIFSYKAFKRRFSEFLFTDALKQ